MNSDIYTFEGIKKAASYEAAETIARVLDKKIYDASKITGWVDDVGCAVLQSLEKMSGNFKYIVNIRLQPKSATGMTVLLS